MELARPGPANRHGVRCKNTAFFHLDEVVTMSLWSSHQAYYSPEVTFVCRSIMLWLHKPRTVGSLTIPRARINILMTLCVTMVIRAHTLWTMSCVLAYSDRAGLANLRVVVNQSIRQPLFSLSGQQLLLPQCTYWFVWANKRGRIKKTILSTLRIRLQAQ